MTTSWPQHGALKHASTIFPASALPNLPLPLPNINCHLLLAREQHASSTLHLSWDLHSTLHLSWNLHRTRALSISPGTCTSRFTYSFSDALPLHPNDPTIPSPRLMMVVGPMSCTIHQSPQDEKASVPVHTVTVFLEPGTGPEG
ncbi:hypothetical protein E2P81_ATG02484 [Venturia nashicola]|nr:hypothetical protein E2P81_ATG02484 [Venturia nashicola]